MPLHRAVPVALVLCALAAPAAAKDTWTDPHPGIRHLYRTLSDPNRLHALKVDLCASGVSLRATRSSERQRTVSSFAGLAGAQAAVNGDFFSYADYSTSGLAAGSGSAWSDTKDSTSSGFVGFGPDLALWSPPSEVHASLPAGVREVVSGHPQIVKKGTAITSYSCSSHYCTKNPRTAAGFSEDRRTLYLVVVDGRSSLSEGMTLAELAQQVEGLGAWDAINLDGGGSTTMWIAGDGVVNDPSDGSQRVVANHLAVLAGGSGAPGSCIPEPPAPEPAPEAGAEDAAGAGGQGGVANGGAPSDDASAWPDATAGAGAATGSGGAPGAAGAAPGGRAGASRQSTRVLDEQGGCACEAPGSRPAPWSAAWVVCAVAAWRGRKRMPTTRRRLAAHATSASARSRSSAA
jgi:hypothetical protein